MLRTKKKKKKKKKKKFAGASVTTLAMLFSALMVGGPPAFAASEGVVVCAQEGAQEAPGGEQGAPMMSQSNQGVFSADSPTATAEANPPPTVDCDL